MSGGGPPALRVDSLAGSLSEEALRSLRAEDWLRYLRGRRWFGAKAADPSVRIVDVIPILGRFAAVRVRAANGHDATYQLVLAAQSGERAPPDALAAVITPQGSGWIGDAAGDPEFLDRLAAAFSAGATFEGARGRWIVEPLGDEGRRALPEGIPSRVLAGEQSNTSFIFGERAIGKIYRRLEPGEQPDAEIGAFLARHSFPSVPRLLGTIRFDDPGGVQTVAGLLQELVPRAEDGWKYTVARLSELRPGDRSLEREAERLGSVTRAFHEALASDPADPEFAPQPIRDEDLRRWIDDGRARVRGAIEIAEAAARRGTFGSSELEKSRAHAAEALSRLEHLRSAPVARLGAKIRHHGDYHLGQVLRSHDGAYWIIDFEGEPTRPLAERRRRHSPIRDVAGMLRSFAYASRVVEREAASPDRGDRPELRQWEASARVAFLRGYGSDRATHFLPAGGEGFDGLRALFEIEKAFYELAYELNNRPDWASIPLANIAMLLGPGAGARAR